MHNSIDIADVVVFVVSDDAHWLMGQNIQVNGGIVEFFYRSQTSHHVERTGELKHDRSI